MKVSIAMASYNGARYLGEQLDSLLHQQRQPDELVVTDDQSTDATAELVRGFARTAPFTVRLEVNPVRLGVTRNFERALTLCTGDLVLLSDQDDVWMPGKIATLEAAARARPAGGCFMNDALLADGGLAPTGATKLGQIRAAGLADSAFVMGCCAAFSRELLDFLLPIPPDSHAHDNWLVQMADFMGLVHRMDVPLQYYRRHGGNVSDFYVNRLQPPGPVRRLQEGLGAFARRVLSPGGLQDEQRLFAAAAQRMLERPERLQALVGVGQAGVVTAAMQSRAALLAKRVAIRALPRLRRASAVAGLLRTGGYRDSGGPAGAVKDLLVANADGTAPR